MTQSIAINANNSIFRGPDGNIAFVTGKDAVAQNCKTAIQAQRGEMKYAVNQGMPTRATAWDTYSPSQFEAAARSIITGVTGVISVTSFSVARNGNTLNYVATIQTIYGGVTFNG